MNICERAAGFARGRTAEQRLFCLLSLALLLATWPQNLWADQVAPAPAQATT